MMGDFGPVRDKWVCPNDRELSLRAKLKAGWSVKTGSINTFSKPQQLSEKEQEVILSVIRRAENLDKVEQERVGRLVERLDNMKKNAMGNGTTQCVLCADEFGILGASPLLCNDCKKAVCTKCGVDTSSVHKEPFWLCKICAETRETWKKSGAWFYRGLPTYILPQKKPEQQSKYARNTSSLETTSSPVRSYNAWLQTKGRSMSDKEFTDSSDDELRSASLSRKHTRRRYWSESVESNESSATVVPQSPQQIPTITQDSLLPNYTDYETTDFHALPENPAVEIVPPRATETYPSPIRSPVRAGPEPPPGSSAALWLKSRRDADEGAVKSPRSRGQIRQELSPSPVNVKNGKLSPVPPRTRQQRDRSADKEQHQQQHQHIEESISPENTSSIEFSVFYDVHNLVLHCTIYRAKGLKTNYCESLADPFVRLQLLPMQDKSDKLRTRTVHKTLNPEFNETVTFFGVNDYDMATKILRLTVVDEDPFGSDTLGETKLILKKLRPQQPKHVHVYLDKYNAMDGDEEEMTRGQVLLSLMYSSEHHALIVGIVRCAELLPRENNAGLCDPYVRLQLKPDHLRRRHKTAAKKKTLSPEYNEEFIFQMKPHDLSKKMLAISVWDKDYGRTDDYIGGLAVGIQSKGERLRHWLDIIRNPDVRVERWHSLSNAVLLD